MKLTLRIFGAIFLLVMVPVSVLWVWFPAHWWQFLITDVILFAGGILTVASSISPLEKSPKDSIIWHSP